LSWQNGAKSFRSWYFNYTAKKFRASHEILHFFLYSVDSMAVLYSAPSQSGPRSIRVS
jgi:hypothetical protein